MGMLTVVLAAANLGLPELMETRGRTTVYYAYLLIVLWCFCADSILSLLFGRILPARGVDLLSILLVFALAAGVCFSGTGKKIRYPQGMQLNDAVLCLTNIIREEQDDTWTIVSANDELHMGEDMASTMKPIHFCASWSRREGRASCIFRHRRYIFLLKKYRFLIARNMPAAASQFPYAVQTKDCRISKALKCTKGSGAGWKCPGCITGHSSL